jgi:two-component system chemotaxis response regulator CheY
MNSNNFSDFTNNGSLPEPREVNCSTIIEELWQDYLDSTESRLPELEAAAMGLEAGKDVEANQANIKRILHSIKGESGMAGVQDIHNLCHEIESAFEKLEDNLKAADMVLRAKDWMAAAIDYIDHRDQIEEEESQEAVVVDRAEEAAAVAESRSFMRALIVDDAVVCRKRLNMLLKNYFECNYAINGKEAYERYLDSHKQGHPFALITLDINMPEWDGHKTLEEVRKWESERGVEGLDGVKVIMTTSQGGSNHIFEAFRQGCEAYVVKSNMGDKLLAEVAKLGLLKVKHYISSDKVICVRKNMPILKAVEVMAENRKTSVPVVNGDMTLAGMLSEKDVLVLLTSESEKTGTVENFMETDVASFDENASLIDVCEHLKGSTCRRMPILSDGKLVDVIDRNDLIGQIVKLRKASEDNKD